MKNKIKECLHYIFRRINFEKTAKFIHYKINKRLRFDLMRVYRIYPNIKYEYLGEQCQTRNDSTVRLFKLAFRKYEDLMKNKYINMFIFTGDKPEDADFYRRLYKLKYIFAYSTEEKYKDKVIPIPDFIFDSWIECGINDYQETVKNICEAGKQLYTDNRAFWIGSTDKGTHITRETLIRLGEKNSDKILSISTKWDTREKGRFQKIKRYVTLEDHCQYKYLIDIQSTGYSGRLKLLLWSNRVVFIVDRKYKEFYFKYLKDGENCIFIREDLSDLVEKINYIEKNPEIYKKIINGSNILAEKYLNKDYVVEYIKDIILKYAKDR